MEGVAVKRNPKEKILKVGKRVAASKIRRAEHSDRDEMNRVQEKNAVSVQAEGNTQDRVTSFL